MIVRVKTPLKQYFRGEDEDECSWLAIFIPYYSLFPIPYSLFPIPYSLPLAGVGIVRRSTEVPPLPLPIRPEPRLHRHIDGKELERRQVRLCKVCG
jgi:hypothetical protein